MWIKFALRADVAYVAEPLVDMRVHAVTVTSWLTPMKWHDEHMAIFHEGFALGVRRYPSLKGEQDRLLRISGRAQGRRFFTAGLAAVARGDFELARGYTAVLDRLRDVGLPRRYGMMTRSLTNGAGRRALQVVAAVRRFRARRVARSVGAKVQHA
jgi:hypothetical protein